MKTIDSKAIMAFAWPALVAMVYLNLNFGSEYFLLNEIREQVAAAVADYDQIGYWGSIGKLLSALTVKNCVVRTTHDLYLVLVAPVCGTSYFYFNVGLNILNSVTCGLLGLFVFLLTRSTWFASIAALGWLTSNTVVATSWWQAQMYDKVIGLMTMLLLLATYGLARRSLCTLRQRITANAVLSALFLLTAATKEHGFPVGAIALVLIIVLAHGAFWERIKYTAKTFSTLIVVEIAYVIHFVIFVLLPALDPAEEILLGGAAHPSLGRKAISIFEFAFNFVPGHPYDMYQVMPVIAAWLVGVTVILVLRYRSHKMLSLVLWSLGSVIFMYSYFLVPARMFPHYLYMPNLFFWIAVALMLYALSRSFTSVRGSQAAWIVSSVFAVMLVCFFLVGANTYWTGYKITMEHSQNFCRSAPIVKRFVKHGEQETRRIRFVHRPKSIGPMVFMTSPKAFVLSFLLQDREFISSGRQETGVQQFRIGYDDPKLLVDSLLLIYEDDLSLAQIIHESGEVLWQKDSIIGHIPGHQ